MKITHLSFDDATRQLAAMRAAMLRQSMSAYVSDLILADAEDAGLTALLGETPASVAEGSVEDKRGES